jgi:hypothetical protein
VLNVEGRSYDNNRIQARRGCVSAAGSATAEMDAPVRRDASGRKPATWRPPLVLRARCRNARRALGVIADNLINRSPPSNCGRYDATTSLHARRSPTQFTSPAASNRNAANLTFPSESRPTDIPPAATAGILSVALSPHAKWPSIAIR